MGRMQLRSTWNMSAQPLNISGMKFGRLTAIKLTKPKKKATQWICRCECGTEKSISLTSLKSGETKSCGCLQKETFGRHSITHGMSKIPEYHIWVSMKQRCYDPSATGFSNYGGRGIKVCDRWRTSFTNFLKDVGVRPSIKHSLDRFPNNDGDYEPSNCRWATKKEQAGNRRSCHLLEFNGQIMTISEWSEKTGIPRNAIYLRINHMGWSIERSLTTPTRRPKK